MLIRILLLMMLGMPGLASAANIFEPAQADRSLAVLDMMFGQLGIFGVGMTDGFAASVAVFNGAALIIGGVLVVYSLFVGTIGTAHDGEMMGKKYSSVWIPLRTVLATALILPVIGGSSYCLMQLIVGWLIVQGVGLADKIWGAYMERNSVIQTITVGLKVNDSNKVAWEIFNSAYCVAALNNIIQDSTDPAKTGSTQSHLKYHVDSNKVPKFGSQEALDGGALKGTVWNFGVLPINGSYSETVKATKDMCGTVEYVFKESTMADLAATTQNQVAGLSHVNYQAPELVEKEKMANAVIAARRIGFEGTKRLIEEIEIVAERYANEVKNGNSLSQANIANDVKVAVKNYHGAFSNQVGTLIADGANLEKLKELSERDGWVMAGAWFMKMAAMQDVVGQIENIRPSAVSRQPSVINKELGNIYEIVYMPSLNQTVTFNGVTLGISEEVSGRKEIGAASNNPLTLSNIITTGISYLSGTRSVEKQLAEMMKELTEKFVIQHNEHPIMVMKKLGEWLFKIANGLIFLNGVASESLESVVRMLTFIFGPMLFALGFTLNYIMPMMPFMIWLGCFLGWLILCVEAILAAPIWAVMHLSMSGDDMVGTGSQGYKLVLSLMLRPALMIFGFIAALTIMQVLGQFVNMVYSDVFLMAQQDAGAVSILIGALAFPALYLGCMWVIIVKCMEIVHKIPDQLLQWFGGGGSQLAQAAESVGGLQSQAFAATQTTGRMMGGVGEQFYRMNDMRLQTQRNNMMQKQQDNEGFKQDMSRLDANAGPGASDVFEASQSGSGNDKIAYNKSAEGQKEAVKMAGVSRAMAAEPSNPQSSGGKALAEMHQKMASSIENGNLTIQEAYNKHGTEGYNNALGKDAFAMMTNVAGMEGTPSLNDAMANETFRNSSQVLARQVAQLDSVSGNRGAEMMGDILSSREVQSLEPSKKMEGIQAMVGKQMGNANGGQSN